MCVYTHTHTNIIQYTDLALKNIHLKVVVAEHLQSLVLSHLDTLKRELALDNLVHMCMHIHKNVC
jgi:hypothetical protein